MGARFFGNAFVTFLLQACSFASMCQHQLFVVWNVVSKSKGNAHKSTNLLRYHFQILQKSRQYNHLWIFLYSIQVFFFFNKKSCVFPICIEVYISNKRNPIHNEFSLFLGLWPMWRIHFLASTDSVSTF